MPRERAMTVEDLAQALGGHRTDTGARPLGVPGGVKYDHHSASSTNLFCASPAMWVAEKLLGLRQPVGAPAHRGVAVEDGVTHGLINPDASLAEWSPSLNTTRSRRCLRMPVARGTAKRFPKWLSK